MSLGENIKNRRRERKISQEYIADQLGVSRQAVSKWETGQSEPSTSNLLELSEILKITLDDLVRDSDGQQKMKIKPEQESKKTRRTRTTIIFLSLTTLFLALVFNELSLILIIISILAISVLLFITKVDGNDGSKSFNKDAKIFKKYLPFTVLFVVVMMIGVFMKNKGLLNREQEKLYIVITVSLFYIFLASEARKFPFNRYTGLRLPWTIYDEATWNIAHEILSLVAFPVCVIFIILSLKTSLDFTTVGMGSFVALILIPGLYSFIYYLRRRKEIL